MKKVSKEVIIKDNVWLCANIISLLGTIIGKNSIVMSGSIVTKSILENEIWRGIQSKK